MSLALLEVCVDNVQSLKNALKGGAKRIELCSCLYKGGLTPSAGFLVVAKKIAKDIPVFVMLRARPGDDFVYTREEQKIMLADLRVLKQLGADGFVYGALNEDGKVNGEFSEDIVKAANPLPVTFHRAFDNVLNDVEALETIISLGFDRILTSGRENCAADRNACERLKTYVETAQGRIVIMAGCGITLYNVDSVLQSGVKEIHGSFKKQIEIQMPDHMKQKGITQAETVQVADLKHVRNMVRFLHNFGSE